MKRPVFISFLILLLLIGLLGMVTTIIVEKVVNDLEAVESFVGREIVLEGDSLLILNYKAFGDTYMLSDGTSIDASFALKLIEDQNDSKPD